MIAVKFVMVNDLDRDRCGLGLTILDDAVGRSVVGINRSTTSNNNRDEPVYIQVEVPKLVK